MKKQIFLILVFLSTSFAQERVLIEGEYSYKWGDNETVLEAKSLCYNMALRNMVESYQMFIASTTDIKNFQLRNDLIQTLSTGYLEDLTVVEERIEKDSNEAYYKLKAYVIPTEFKRVLQEQVKRKLNIYKPQPVSETKHYRVLKQWKEESYYTTTTSTWISICTIYQAKSPTYSPLQYKITFYDNEGFPLGGNKWNAHPENRPLSEGEVRRSCQDISLPKGTSYYEIW